MTDIPGAICSECAKKNGGEWPEGHVASFWPGKCSACGDEASCCCTTDFNWPGRKLKADDMEREI